jgi:hypothetical protein
LNNQRRKKETISRSSRLIKAVRKNKKERAFGIEEE